MAKKTLNAEAIRLFSFNQIGACLNEGVVSTEDASSVLLARAQRKATEKAVKIDPATGAVLEPVTA